MKRVKIREIGPLALEMTFPRSRRKTERLAIMDPFYPRTELAVELFRSLGTMQLVAPFLPEVIDTDFGVNVRIARLIGSMYRSCDHDRPHFTTNYSNRRFDVNGTLVTNKFIVSHSSGKDSLHSVMRGQDSWGEENVMPVHIAGLNTSNASGERKYAYRQARELGFPHFREVVLKSSAKCTKNGYEVMRSRDFFMTGILVPVALQFGASDILTEGFAETLEDEPFTGKEENMRAFNKLLKALGIPVQVVWFNIPEMDVIRQVYEERPEWMPHVHNCFSIACRKDQRRDSWMGSKKKRKKGRTPSWPLYDSQCGSCVKCRITRLGQLMYDKNGMALVKPQEVRVFLKATAKYTRDQWRDWYRGKQNHRDMMVGSFIKDLIHAMSKQSLYDEIGRLEADIKYYEVLVAQKKKEAA